MKNFAKKSPVPANKVGIGLRAPHVSYILKNPKKIAKIVGFLEVHSENYYNLEGRAIQYLQQVREDFPISFHSVGNSLGSASGLDIDHLKNLKDIVEIINPFLISDHISWGKVDKNHYNDLLPLPYTKDALKVICDNISKMQDFLKRQILVENPSAYLAFKNQEMDEAEFINELCKKTGCKLLLDVNNVFVSAQNNKEFEPFKYLKTLNKKLVGEIHLAGHSKREIFDGKNNKEILIDTHSDIVCNEVWEIYQAAIKKFGKIPSLIEWDVDVPELDVLLGEAKKAAKILKQ